MARKRSRTYDTQTFQPSSRKVNDHLTTMKKARGAKTKFINRALEHYMEYLEKLHGSVPDTSVS